MSLLIFCFDDLSIGVSQVLKSPTILCYCQNWWRNQKLFRQAKVKRIQYHHTSFTTNVKGTYIDKKYKRTKKDLQNWPQTIKKMAIGTYISIITINVNGLNAPTKRHRLAERI